MVANLMPVDLRGSSNSVETLGQPLPPSERDFDVFLMVAVENASTRTAAARFGVSQTRIMQIRDRVAEWIGKSVPAAARLSVRERVRLSAYVASERTNFLLAEVVEAWRNSRGEETIVRRNGRGETTAITRTTQGEPRYLMMAMRINEHSLRLAGRAEEVLAKAEERAEEAPAETNASDAPEVPPVGDCSAEAAGEEVVVSEVAETADANVDAPDVCDETSERRRAFFAAQDVAECPVQPATLEDEAPGVFPLAAGAESLRLRPLSRKERRARQRMLKKLRRAKAQ